MTKFYFKAIVFAVILLNYSVGTAQGIVLNWAIGIGGTGADVGNSITTDAYGNTYTIGNFSGTLDFDPSPKGTYNLTSAGGTDIFIQKLDANGNFVWAKRMGGTSDDAVTSIIIKGTNIYTTGYFQKTVDFNPSSATFNITSAGLSDIFIQKLDVNGNFVWAKAMGGPDWDVGNSISTDEDGNIYTTGGFIDKVDFDPSEGTYNLTSASGYYDIFIQKLTSSGNLIWAKAMGGMSSDVGYSIITDAYGNTYTTGSFSGTADFDPSAGTYNLTSAGSYDIVIQKLDASGNFVWAKRMGGTDWDGCYSISTDDSGNVYTTGFFWRTADFDPSDGTYNLTSAGSTDIFIQKLDANGNFVWAKALGGIYTDIAYSISTDPSGNIYTAGSFQGTADFDPSTHTYYLTSAGSIDIFIQKLDANGNFVWAKRMGGTSDDAGTSISTNASNKIYITGYFNETADFDQFVTTTKLTSAGGPDIFIAKYTQTSTGISDLSINGISIYPNPTSGIVHIYTGNQKIKRIKLFNSEGQLIQEYFANDFSVSNFPDGVYLIKIETDNLILTRKLIKQ